MAKEITERDDFYTTVQTARACIAVFNRIAPPCDLYIEPSAGGGAFFNDLPGVKIGLDIAPTTKGVIQADFLTWSPPADHKTIAVIGNPPFNCQNGTAIQFFNHAATMGEWIAMILPASFGKLSVQRQLDPRFELIHQTDLPDETFYREGKPIRINACFQIWKRGLQSRQIQRLPSKHNDFEVVKTLANADFAIRRIGARAGDVIEITDDRTTVRGLSPSSNYYIRATNVAAEQIRSIFEAIEFTETRKMSVAVPSVSKPELVALYHDQKLLTEQSEASEASEKVICPKITETNLVRGFGRRSVSTHGSKVLSAALSH